MFWPRCKKHNIFFMTACPDCKREKLPTFDEWFNQPVAYRVYNRNHELKGEFKTMAEVNAWLNSAQITTIQVPT